MEKLSDERKQEIVKALKKNGAVLACPRCKNDSFSLLDGYFTQAIQTQLGGVVLGGRTVPSAVLACDRCGFLSQHALGPLGLLPKKEARGE